MKDKIVETLKQLNLRKQGANKYTCSLFRSCTVSDLSDANLFEVLTKAGVLEEFFKRGFSVSEKKSFIRSCLEDASYGAWKESVKSVGEIFDGTDFFVDVDDHETLFYYDEGKNITSKFDIKSLEMVHGREEIQAVIKSSINLGRLVFNPSRLEPRWMEKEGMLDVCHINTHQPPPWVNQKVTPQIPSSVEKFIGHLFTENDASIEYVLDWLHYAIVARNETALTLNAGKGVGKGVFSELVRALIGRDYFAEAPESLFKSNFNSILKNKRLIYVDEVRVDKEGHTKLKRFLNKYQNVEEKGKDAKTSIETFNSFLITSNDLSDMHLEHDDRRFSVPDVTEDNLLCIWNEKEINDFVNMLAIGEAKEIAQFGHFLLERKPVNSVYKAFKGGKFTDLVLTSLKVWQQFLIDYITMGTTEESISHPVFARELRKFNYSSRPPTFKNVVKFLEEFTHEGQPIGKVIKGEDAGSWEIKIDKRFVTSSEDLEDDSGLDI